MVTLKQFLADDYLGEVSHFGLAALAELVQQGLEYQVVHEEPEDDQRGVEQCEQQVALQHAFLQYQGLLKLSEDVLLAHVIDIELDGFEVENRAPEHVIHQEQVKSNENILTQFLE